MKIFLYKIILLFCTFLFLKLGAEEKFEFDFNANNNGFVGDFTDYPVGNEEFYELSWGWANLPKSCQ